ncbi:hypothetical protein CJ030_MR6G028228 [Morella rubra]|uniref:Uncharacterized protein n=1 Tax=Morella rubra TaxID=262757 RepID=A0A6A1VCF4_9ROSI|nr:hypothetical protein CJ030_MR6G028228 [Morella rubra]
MPAQIQEVSLSYPARSLQWSEPLSRLGFLGVQCQLVKINVVKLNYAAYQMYGCSKENITSNGHDRSAAHASEFGNCWKSSNFGASTLARGQRAGALEIAGLKVQQFPVSSAQAHRRTGAARRCFGNCWTKIQQFQVSFAQADWRAGNDTPAPAIDDTEIAGLKVDLQRINEQPFEQPKKKGRGPAKGTEFDKLRKLAKIPLRVKENASGDSKLTLMKLKLLQGDFVLDWDRFEDQECVKTQLQVSFRQYRYKLHRIYKKFNNTDIARANPPDDVSAAA